MKKRELTKKLLKGSPCEMCSHKWMTLLQQHKLPYATKGPAIVDIARSSNGEEGWCSMYPEPNEAPGYKTQCTCKHYVKGVQIFVASNQLAFKPKIFVASNQLAFKPRKRHLFFWEKR